jgi:DNA-binding CsgD family transcriptional regulator
MESCETSRIEPESASALRDTSVQLTAAQKRVLDLVSLAKTNKEIAAALNISPATVKRHLENILRKAHLKNRVEAAIYALALKGCPRASKRNCLLKAHTNVR